MPIENQKPFETINPKETEGSLHSPLARPVTKGAAILIPAITTASSHFHSRCLFSWYRRQPAW